MDFTTTLTAAIQAVHDSIAHAPDPRHKAQLAGALRILLQVQAEVYGPDSQQAQGGQSPLGDQAQQGAQGAPPAGLGAMLAQLQGAQQ